MTRGQLEVLVGLAQKREIAQMKFQAKLHGGKIDEKKFDTEQEGTPGDPDSYAHLSMEERKELTQKQLGRHKEWAKDKTRMV